MPRVLVVAAFLVLAALLGWNFLAAPPVAPVAGPPRASAPPVPSFLRFRETGERAGLLETAVASYEGPRGVRVDLVATAHVADATYYRRLGEAFPRYDAVLYEMVKPRGYVPRREDRAEGVIAFLQRAIKNVLQLEFQLDAIDYGQRNFVHADLDSETFARLQRERGESIVGLLFRLASREMERMMREGADAGADPAMLTLERIAAAFSGDDAARDLKLLLAREMIRLESILSGLEVEGADENGKAEGSVIVGERNAAAIRALRAQMKKGKKSFAILYGAAHMPDLERRLVEELGFTRTAIRWEVAWDIGGGAAAPTSGADPPR